MISIIKWSWRKHSKLVHTYSVTSIAFPWKRGSALVHQHIARMVLQCRSSECCVFFDTCMNVTCFMGSKVKRIKTISLFMWPRVETRVCGDQVKSQRDFSGYSSTYACSLLRFFAKMMLSDNKCSLWLCVIYIPRANGVYSLCKMLKIESRENSVLLNDCASSAATKLLIMKHFW